MQNNILHSFVNINNKNTSVMSPLIQNYRPFPQYTEHLGPNHGLSVVVESYFGLNDFSKASDFKLYIHQSGSIPDMLNSTTIEVARFLKFKILKFK